jgi:hypothetical protein
MLSDTALAEAARYCDNDLALVLGERLHDLIDVEDQLEAAQVTIEDLQNDMAALDAERVELEAQLDEILRPDK